MTTLKELAAMLDAATGITPELWAHVSCALLAPTDSKVEQSPFNGAWVVYEPQSYGNSPFRCWEKEPRDIRSFRDARAWADAALALVERLLPVSWVRIERLTLTRWQVRFEGGETVHWANAPTAPLAILKALVAALIAQEKNDEA